MLSLTFSFLIRNWHYYLLFFIFDLAVTMISIIAISQWSVGVQLSLTVATTVLWLAFNFFILRASVFHNETVLYSAAKPSLTTFVPFVAKGFVLYLIVLAICAPIFFAFDQASLSFFPDGTVFGPIPLLILAFFAGATLVFSSVFALLGTWLPATVHGVAPQFSRAVIRGSRMFWRSFWRILPLLIVFPTLLSWGVPTILFPTAFLFPADIEMTFPMVIEAAISSILSAIFATVMMIALSMNYFDAEKMLDEASLSAP